MKTKKDFLRVAVHTPLRRTFDYLPNKETELKILKPGIRVSIPFGKQRNVSGVIISINSKSEYPYHKLKKINYVIDESPVIDSKHLDLLIWASTYYHHPIGEVIHNPNIKSDLGKIFNSADKYIKKIVIPSKKEVKNILLWRSSDISGIERITEKGGNWIILIKSATNVLKGDNFVFVFQN